MKYRRFLVLGVIAALAVLAGCDDDCDTVPCGNCEIPPAVIYPTDVPVSDTLTAKAAFYAYALALDEDPELIPPGLATGGAYDLGYIESRSGFVRAGITYWQIVVSYPVNQERDQFFDLFVSQSGVIVQRLYCL